MPPEDGCCVSLAEACGTWRKPGFRAEVVCGVFVEVMVLET